jgi:hypothetical protein
LGRQLLEEEAAHLAAAARVVQERLSPAQPSKILEVTA